MTEHKADDLITMTEAAYMLGISQRTIARWVKIGKLQAVRPYPNVVRVRVGDVERLRAND